MQGVDFDQTFCATMRSGSLRLLCSLAARHSLDMRRWDFVSAYLQGELLEDEVVYCQMPPATSWSAATDVSAYVEWRNPSTAWPRPAVAGNVPSSRG